MVKWRGRSAVLLGVILASCVLLESFFLLITCTSGSTFDAWLDQPSPLVERQDRDTMGDSSPVGAPISAPSSPPQPGKRVSNSPEKHKPKTVPRFDLSESTSAFSFSRLFSPSMSPSNLESRDDEAVEAEALGGSEDNRESSYCPRSTGWPPRGYRGQILAAITSKKSASYMKIAATRNVMKEIDREGQIEAPDSCGKIKPTMMGGGAKAPFQASDSKKNILPEDVEAVGVTMPDITEVSPSRDVDASIIPMEKGADVGMDVYSSSNGVGGTSTASESLQDDDGEVNERECEPREQGVRSYSGRFSCPDRDNDRFPRAAVPELGARERRGPLVKGVGTNIAAVDSDPVHGGDVTRYLTAEEPIVEVKVLVDKGRLPWVMWACTTLLCVVLLVYYEYLQGKLPQWVPFIGGERREGWAVDLDHVVALARSRAGSIYSGGASGTVEGPDDLKIPDLVLIDEPPFDDASGGRTVRACDAEEQGDEDVEELMWDTRPKPYYHLVFDPVLGVVPQGVVDAWARAGQERADANGGGNAVPNRCALAPAAMDDDSTSPRGDCCGNSSPLERRGHQKKRALPPVRYTPEWYAWRTARAETARSESTDQAGAEDVTGSELPRLLPVDNGKAEGAATPTAPLVENGHPHLAKIRLPVVTRSEFEGAMATAKFDTGGSEGGGRNTGAGDGENTGETSTEVRDGARSSECCSAELSSPPPEVSPVPLQMQPCL